MRSRDGAAREAGRRGGWRLAALELAILSVLASGLLYLLSLTPADSDLWGHVRFGQLFRSAGRLPATDPFSFLGGRWLNHEWLSEVVLAFLWDGWGPVGLIGWKLTVGGLIAGLLFRHLVGRGADRLRAAGLTLFLLLPMLPGLAPVRPQLFTYLFFLLLLLALDAAERGRRAWLWGLPPLFGLWANLHGGVLAGLGWFGLWAILSVVAASARRVRVGSGRERSEAGAPARFGGGKRERLLLPALLGLCVLATFLNPFGPRLLAFLLRTATVSRPEIVEWQPIELATGPGIGYLALVALLVTALAALRPRLSVSLVLVGGSALLPLLAVRHLPLFALAVGVLGGEPIVRLIGRLGPDPIRGWPAAGSRPKAAERLVYSAGLLLLLGLAASTVARSVRRPVCLESAPGAGGLRYPARAVRALAHSGAEGRLLVPFNWGQYAIWHLGPRLRVSMDGRRETVYAPETYAAFQSFMRGIGEWSGRLRRLRPDVALVPRGSSVYNLFLLEPGWWLAYEDSLAAIFLPADSPLRGPLTVATRSVAGEPVERACFP
ncbi:MAG: hypothetical protein ACE5HP_02520 [Gemmatimonadota bacterium]